jgi:hypothetical protein
MEFVTEENITLSIRDALYEKLKLQRDEDFDTVYRKYTGGEREEKVDQIERDFDFNLDKLDLIYELEGKLEDVRLKFAEMALYIDDKSINKGNGLDVLLTYGALLSRFSDLIMPLESESAYLLSTAMICAPVSQYENLINPVIVECNRSLPTNEYGRELLYELFDYMDDFYYVGMSTNEFLKVISDCINIVKKYEKSKTIGGRIVI